MFLILALLVSPSFALPIVTTYDLVPSLSPPPSDHQPHPAVVENAIAESQLPSELLNPFYKDPVIAAGLAKESWFTNKEYPVYHREADKIPRSEIIKLISRIQHASEV